MILALYISLGLFFISTCVFIYLYIRNLSRLKNVINDVVNLNIRNGYYREKVDLLTESNADRNNTKNFDAYDLVVYVTELDRYTNGQSKIKLDKVEIISGFKPNQYEYVKQTIRDRFCSLKDTSTIEWLESENAIKEQRKEKLNKIIENSGFLHKIFNKK